MEGFCEFLEVLISVDFKIFIINRSETHVRRAEAHEELLEVLVLRESKCRLVRGYFPRVMSAEMFSAKHSVRGFWVGRACLQVTPEDSMESTSVSTLIDEVFEWEG
jgi:hypothetical protein